MLTLRNVVTVRISNRFRLGVLGLLVSLMALYFITSQINRDLFVEALVSARYIYLIPTILFLLAGLVTRAFRWQLLLSGALPIRRAFSIMNVAYLVNGVLPLRIGEVARVYLASRVEEPVPIPKTTSTIIVERLLDLLAVVIMLLLALAVAPVPAQIQVAGLTTSIMALIGFTVLVVMARQRARVQHLLALVVARVSFLQRFALAHWLDQFLDGLTPLTNLGIFFMALGWTALSWTLSVIAGYLLMFAFFDSGNWAATMLYIAAAAFAIALPAVPGNIGTYEASILLALGALGYGETSTAVAFAVMVHAVNVGVHAATGVVGFIQEGISLGQLTQGIQQMQHTSEVG